MGDGTTLVVNGVFGYERGVIRVGRGFLWFRYLEDLPRPKVVRTFPPVPLPVAQVTTRSGQQVAQVTTRSGYPLPLFGMC